MQALNFPEGWRVFPCTPDAKEPMQGFKDWPTLATDDPTQIAKWAVEYPGCNWAVALGASGLAVVDIDPPAGEDSLTMFEIENGSLPATREHRSARGGRHLIFNDITLSCANSVGKLGPKLDTRGQNGYIIIPPSTFNGAPYELLADRRLADIPDYVAAAAGRRREAVGAAAGVGLDDDVQVGRARKLLADYVQRGHVAVEGAGGDDRTFAVSAEVLNLGLSVDKAHELIDEVWNVACVPPWDAEELLTKITNAASYAQNEAGAWAVPPVAERLSADVLDRLIAASPEREAPTQKRFDWMGEDRFRHLTPPAWLIQDMLTERGLSMLFGPSGHFKSFIGLALGAEVASKTGACVFYVAGEGIARMALKDWPAWKTLHGETRDLPFYMQEDMPLWTENADDYMVFAESIRTAAAGRPIGLIVLDTTNRAMLGLDENSAKDVAKFLAAAEALKRTFNCNVMLVHHTPDADQYKARGSSAIFAGLDTVLRVDADKETRLVKVWVQKQKNSEERERPFCYRGEKVGAGLAFVQIDQSAMRKAEEQIDLLDQATILKALVGLQGHDVTSRVLVTTITARLPDEMDEHYNALISDRLRILSALLKKGMFKGMYAGEGHALRWALPQ